MPTMTIHLSLLLIVAVFGLALVLAAPEPARGDLAKCGQGTDKALKKLSQTARKAFGKWVSAYRRDRDAGTPLAKKDRTDCHARSADPSSPLLDTVRSTVLECP